MCGIFGYVSAGEGRPNLKRLERIARVTESRGRHAFGFAWLDRRGRMRCFKQTGRISDHLGLLAMMSDARILIGHARYATQGDPADNINNHPHPCDGGWLVHNGTVPRYLAIDDEWGLRRCSDCDSETIALLIERMDGSRLERAAQAVAELQARSTAILTLSRGPDELVLVRAGNPLRMGATEEGVYLASLSDGLPGGGREVDDDTAMSLTRDADGEIHARTIPIEPEEGWAGAAANGAGACRSGGESQAHPRSDGRPAKSRTRPRFADGQ